MAAHETLFLERERHPRRVPQGPVPVVLHAHSPDMLCLQETKAERDQVEIDLPDYREYWNSAVKKGYSGTAIFSKPEPMRVINGFPRDFAEALQLRGRAAARQRRRGPGDHRRVRASSTW